LIFDFIKFKQKNNNYYYLLLLLFSGSWVVFNLNGIHYQALKFKYCKALLGINFEHSVLFFNRIFSKFTKLF